jgi:hypothetical protein
LLFLSKFIEKNLFFLNFLFSFTINDVQAKSKYLWRYQRYELIREYFEQPFFAYPPLSLFVYLYFIFGLIFNHKNTLRIFSKFFFLIKEKNLLI